MCPLCRAACVRILEKYATDWTDEWFAGCWLFGWLARLPRENAKHSCTYYTVHIRTQHTTHKNRRTLKLADIELRALSLSLSVCHACNVYSSRETARAVRRRRRRSISSSRCRAQMGGQFGVGGCGGVGECSAVCGAAHVHMHTFKYSFRNIGRARLRAITRRPQTRHIRVAAQLHFPASVLNICTQALNKLLGCAHWRMASILNLFLNIRFSIFLLQSVGGVCVCASLLGNMTWWMRRRRSRRELQSDFVKVAHKSIRACNHTHAPNQ